MSHPTALSVNLNKIALLRNSRTGNSPSVTEFAQICLNAGAQGITVHPRPDQRHIRPDDVFALARLVKQQPGIEFNIEGNPFSPERGDYPGFLNLVQQTRPDQCTLVPDTDQQLTSDHGFDLHKDGDRLQPIIQQLQQLGIRVSLFMDPVIEQIALAHKIGADRIELYTGPYAEAFQSDSDECQVILDQHIAAAEAANALGLGVNAGHDLNLNNLPHYRRVPRLLEVSIGHALTIDALRYGMENTVNRYLTICRE